MKQYYCINCGVMYLFDVYAALKHDWCVKPWERPCQTCRCMSTVQPVNSEQEETKAGQ